MVQYSQLRRLPGIQIDAASNPGNSGGGGRLVDMQVGIVAGGSKGSHLWDIPLAAVLGSCS